MVRVAAAFLGLFLCLRDVPAVKVDKKTLDMLMNTTGDVIRDTSAIINDMEGIRIRSRNTPEFECGYLNKMLEEFFRKQVNVFNTSKYMNTRLYSEEMVLYLEEIEHNYWQIEHVGNMLHEVERKHKIGILQADAIDDGVMPDYHLESPPDRPSDIKRPRPSDSIDMSPELGKIFGELSWTSRLQLLDQYYPSPNKTVMSMDSLMQPMRPKNNDLPPASYGAPPEPPQRPRLPPPRPLPPVPPSMNEDHPGQRQRSRRADRRVGLSALRMPNKPVAGRRQTPSGDYPPTNSPPHRDDDTSMKLKLFRLMYETVRDSDLKVKRAELIKTQYVNSSAFEVGYLLGDISDKYNIMSDIALTLQRLYSEWRPIEHINAYEQIANQAIEISHLIDLAKTVHKRNDNTGNKNE